MSNLNRPIKAVFFDIGGVVVQSPLIAIHEYEREKGLPKDWLNLHITRRGRGGAWQRFERDELQLYPFYKEFGEELSDVARGNEYYEDWCKSKNVAIPRLPDSVAIDGRELFGRMMRSATTLHPYILGAIRNLRQSGRFRIVALTNNYSAQYERLRAMKDSRDDTSFDPDTELNFLGWGSDTGGPAGPRIRDLFDDFVDSSIVGSRKPEPGIYEYACKANGVKPSEVVFLDDLGINLRTARKLGMKTIHVPIGGSPQAVAELEKLVNIPLLGTDGLEYGARSKL